MIVFGDLPNSAAMARGMAIRAATRPHDSHQELFSNFYDHSVHRKSIAIVPHPAHNLAWGRERPSQRRKPSFPDASSDCGGMFV
jgi:hypothetical protein